MSRVPALIVDIDYTESPRLLTHLRLKTLDGQVKIVTVDKCVPRFWTEKDPTDLELPGSVKSARLSNKTSIEGTPLWEIRVDLPSNIRELRDYFFPHYCSDVRWSSLVRWIYGWTSVIEIDEDDLMDERTITPSRIKPSNHDPNDFDLSVVWFDIETEDCLDVDGTEGRVVSIAIMDSITGIHEVGTTVPVGQRQVKRMLSSRETLEGMVEHQAGIDPIPKDKIKVVNFEYTDSDTNEAALLWWFKTRIEELDRDLIGGQNIKAYDIPYLRNRCLNMIKEMNARHQGNVPVFHRYPNMNKVLRKPMFDSKKAFAEQVQGEMQSGSLAWMAETVLGYGKVPRTRITDLMVSDPVLLAAYNIWDNVVVDRCMKSLDLISFYLVKTAFHNSTMKSAHSNMMLIEDMMGHLLMKENKVQPSISLTQSKLVGGIEEGGFVMEAPIGVFEASMELDNTAEYPAQMITANLSPDTLVDPGKYGDEYPFPVTIAPSGRVYRRDREGIFPRVLRELLEERKRIQAEMREAYSNNDEELAEILNRKQRVIKESCNSWYGVLGSGNTEKTRARPFRLANPGIGSDITEGARLHNAWNKDMIEATSLFFTKDGVEPFIEDADDGIRLDFKVIGQDTDSCKVTIINHDEACEKIRKINEDDVKSIANLLCIMLNGSYDDFVKKTFNVDKNSYLYVKPDAYYERFFSWGVKKRYAYREYDGKQSFRGVEIRRSSSPSIVKNAQMELFTTILDGADRKKVNDTLRRIHSDLLDPQVIESIDFGQPFGVKKEGTFAWKASMWSNQNLGTNFDIGDKPVLFLASSSSKGGLPKNRVVAIEWGETPESFGITVDREASFEKFFVNSTSWIGILGAFQTSWEKALAGMSQTDMDEWFK